MIYHRDLRIGDVVPLEGKRGIVGEKLDKPVWHPVRVAPGKEISKSSILDNETGVYSFVPTEETLRRVGNKRVLCDKPTVTQIVYAKFWRRPNWDVLKERQIINGVFCVGGKPVVLTQDAIRIIQGLPTRAEELQRAKEELMRVNAGERVRLKDGPFEGMEVDVTDANLKKVWWATALASGLPLSGEVSRESVEKIDAN